MSGANQIPKIFYSWRGDSLILSYDDDFREFAEREIGGELSPERTQEFLEDIINKAIEQVDGWEFKKI